MCYKQRKVEGGVGALRVPDNTNFSKSNGRYRNLNIYVVELLATAPFYVKRDSRSWVVRELNRHETLVFTICLQSDRFKREYFCKEIQSWYQNKPTTRFWYITARIFY